MDPGTSDADVGARLVPLRTHDRDLGNGLGEREAVPQLVLGFLFLALVDRDGRARAHHDVVLPQPVVCSRWALPRVVAGIG